jgi:metallophosphoesterase (TIGR00282 family)
MDIHAESTSEKVALGYYFDGRISMMFGTHTHVATADERILPKGSAYITDIGMCGPYLSSIGRDVDAVVKKFITGMPARFEIAEGPATLEGAVVEIDPATKLAVSIEPVRVREPYRQG